MVSTAGWVGWSRVGFSTKDGGRLSGCLGGLAICLVYQLKMFGQRVGAGRLSGKGGRAGWSVIQREGASQLACKVWSKGGGGQLVEGWAANWLKGSRLVNCPVYCSKGGVFNWLLIGQRGGEVDWPVDCSNGGGQLIG